MSDTDTDTDTAAWAAAWETAHNQATGSPATLVEGYNVYLAGGVPSQMESSIGRISAVITPRHSEPARATIRITTLSRDEEQALIAALARSRHKAALLKGRLPAALADPEQSGDVPLAPTAAQLSYTCDCHQAPCQHTAALGHAVTQRLHANPSLLATLRGLPHRRLSDLLNPQPTPTVAPAPAKNNPPAPSRRPEGPYIAAHQAYQHWNNAPTTPSPHSEPGSDGPAAPERFAQMALPEPPSPAPCLNRLHRLATQAAAQAQQLLGHTTLLETDPVADAVRMIAALPAGEQDEDVAYRLDLEPPELRRLLAAHALAGTAGVHTAQHPYTDDPAVLQQAAAAIAPLRPDATTPLTCADNRVTDPSTDLEIRHGHDGHWYTFAGTGHAWQLIAAPAADPAGAYRNALAALHTRTRPGR
ncbi:hypothetical protein [Kitasatospora sp. NPDC051164]|uniref:hypothetical protein n=1 Tax=Kitasatospora sp. NPDC051164 TaxID=3364055 RepID=UPI0037991FF0